MSGNITQSSATHAASAARFEADGDWAQAAAEWQAAIDSLNPSLGTANANAIVGYQIAIANAVAGSRGAPHPCLARFAAAGAFTNARTNQLWAGGTGGNWRAAGSFTGRATVRMAASGAMGGRGLLSGRPS
jgi:hypothetical protein